MNSKLYDAVTKDKIDVLKEMEGLLSVGDELTPTCNTVLHLASLHGSVLCVHEILRVHEGLLLKINSRDETALHLAARQGHDAVVHALIRSAKSSVRQHNNLENKAPSTLVQSLIRCLDIELETALHVAVRYNHQNVVGLLVTEDPSHSHSRNKHEETPLYMASIRCNDGIIRKILEHCESPMFGGPGGRTALLAAVMDPRGQDCVRLLLEKNKDLIKVADDHGWTVFHYVACNNAVDVVVQYLVDADKSVGYLVDNDNKRTALHVAAYSGNICVMKTLVKYYPDSWESIDGSGRNILHIAVEQGQTEVIDFILSQDYTARNNLLIQRDREGNTPLHMMAKLGCYVQELMDPREARSRGVDQQVLDSNNLTPLDVLQRRQDPHQVTQTTVERMLINANVRKPWNLWLTIKKPDLKSDIETENRVERQNERINQAHTEYNKAYMKTVNSHMVVAALIATVALTAGFTVPGGFDGNEGPTKGSVILLRKTAFKTFMITDTIALLFSISSLFLYFITTLYQYVYQVGNLVIASAALNVVSVIAMMMAFMSGTYAVLAHSSALAISVCVISSLFFVLVLCIFTKLVNELQQMSSINWR